MIINCFKIFIARMIDVMLGTVRTIYSVKGKAIISSILAFIEIMIWFFAAKEALNSEGNLLIIAIFYSLGYATGNLIGTLIAEHYIKGYVSVFIVTKKNNHSLFDAIRNSGYGISIIPINNSYDNKKKEMLLIETNKKSLNNLIKIIKANDSKTFYIVNETKYVHEGLIKK